MFLAATGSSGMEVLIIIIMFIAGLFQLLVSILLTALVWGIYNASNRTSEAVETIVNVIKYKYPDVPFRDNRFNDKDHKPTPPPL